MASTRLVRKALRNRSVAKRKLSTIKRLTNRPVIKNVDIEQIKEEFAKNNSTPAAKVEAPVKEAPKTVEKAVKAPKEKATPEAKEVKKASPKKAAAKKATPKAKKEAGPKAKKEDGKATE